MPSTYSPTLRLELIGQGEQDGTWGTTTNNNFGALVEQAITGVQTITFVDANYTLTAFNGIVDESRNAVLVLSGTNTTTRQLIAPAVEKVYVIANNTGAGVTVKTASGTGVTVPNGATQIVYCDGVNFALAASQTNVVAGTGINVATSGINSTVSVNPSVTATLSDVQTLTNKTLTSPTLTNPNIGTPTFGTLTNCTGLPLASGVSGTLPVANGGTGVTSSTGSGANVLNTSPTLITPILGTPTSGTLTNCTGLPLTSGVTGTLPVANGGSGVTTSTGTGSLVLSTSPTLVAPLLGTPTSGTLTNCTGLPLTSGVTGTLPVANGGTGVTSSTGSGSVVLSASPALSGAPTAPTAAVSTDNTQIATTAFVRDILPAGVICMWSGAIGSIPAGWLLCDGSNGTPDLRDRFIVGAGSSYSPGNTGGATTVTPSGSVSGSVGNTSLTEAQMPRHYHRTWGPWPGYTGNVPGVDSAGRTFVANSVFNGGTPDDQAYDFGTWSTGSGAASGGTTTGTANGDPHNHSFSGSFSGSSQENRPPYYALAYIMKS